MKILMIVIVVIVDYKNKSMIKKEWHFMQTPKEKAYQLAKAFYVETTTSTEAKQCAKLHISLILENEIIKPSNNIEYYQEVLNEIEKL
jgi:hypothetical protein